MNKPKKIKVFLFKKTLTVCVGKDPKAAMAKLSEHIRSYLDETKKTRPTTWGYMDPTGAVIKPEVLTKSVKYLSKEAQGRIHVHGFLRKLIAEHAGKAVDQLSNTEIAMHAETVWKARLAAKHLTKYAHKIVLSLHPEVCREMEARRVPVDETLLSMTDEVLSGYAARFYPGESLGYLVGIHHDRKHIHAHILLFPQTERGTGLCVSHWSRTKLPDGTVKRVDYQGWIKAKVEKVGVEMYHEKIKGKIRSSTWQNLPEEYNIQERLLSTAAWKYAPDGPTKDQEAVNVRQNLEGLPDPQLSTILTTAYKSWESDYRDLTPGKAASRRAQITISRENIRKMVADKITDPTCAWPARHQFIRDLFRAKGVILGWRKIGFGTRAFRESSTGIWWRERSKENDVLGRWMARAEEETNTKFPSWDRSVGLAGRRFAWTRKRDLMQRLLLEVDQVRCYQDAEFASKLEAVAKARADRRVILEAARIRSHVADLQMLNIQGIEQGSKPRPLKQFAFWQKSHKPTPVSMWPPRPIDLEAARDAFMQRQAPATSKDLALADAVASDQITLNDNGAEIPSLPPNATGVASVMPLVPKRQTPTQILRARVPEPEIDAKLATELGLEL